jgi:hypothetical protein
MSFAEALERFAGVDPKQMHANIASKKEEASGRQETTAARWLSLKT